MVTGKAKIPPIQKLNSSEGKFFSTTCSGGAPKQWGGSENSEHHNEKPKKYACWIRYQKSWTWERKLEF